MMPAVNANQWIVRPQPNAYAALRLFCFPYAGGGASIFRTWADKLSPEVEVCAIQLPGRENRLRESLFTHVTPLVETLRGVLEPYLDKPFVFFGHSMGALIAFELARELRRQGRPQPFHIFASGRPAPHLSDGQAPTYKMPQDKFMEQLHHLGGTPPAILQNAELMQLVLPILRADFAVNESYVYYDEDAFDVPISAFGGLADAKVSYDEVKQWERHAGATFSLRMFPGDHFFINSAQSLVVRAISNELAALAY